VNWAEKIGQSKLSADWSRPTSCYTTIVCDPNYMAYVCCWISVLVNGAFERAIKCILKARLVGARTENDAAERQE